MARPTAIRVLQTLYPSPSTNAVCKQYLGSVGWEYLDHLLVVSEWQLYRVVKEYGFFFNAVRPH